LDQHIENFALSIHGTPEVDQATIGREIDLVEGGKQPYFISAANGELLSIAGLWDGSESVLSCTLIVTAANDFTQRIHDRMPVLLGHHDFEAWLTGKAGVELLRLAPNDLLCMWPVSKRVNVSGRGDDDPSSHGEVRVKGLDSYAHE
jgi:putative SOS response-associated peptidase YedK